MITTRRNRSNHLNIELFWPYFSLSVSIYYIHAWLFNGPVINHPLTHHRSHFLKILFIFYLPHSSTRFLSTSISESHQKSLVLLSNLQLVYDWFPMFHFCNYGPKKKDRAVALTSVLETGNRSFHFHERQIEASQKRESFTNIIILG